MHNLVEHAVTMIGVAWLSMRLAEEVLKPLYEKANLDLFYFKYVAMALGFGLMWSTGLNAVPIFHPLVGRIVTCMVVGLGPSFIYDLIDKEPSVPPIK